MIEADANAPIRRIETGNSRIDRILHGGFPAGSINVIMGHPGTGKTILAEQLLFHNAGPDFRALFLTTLSEPLSKVVTYLQGFDFYDEARMLDHVTYDDVGPGLLEHGVDHLVDRLGEAIREERPRVIVIDSFKAIHDLGTDEAEMRRLVARLAGLLSAYDATAFLVGEYDREHVAHYPEFAVADGIVELSRVTLGRRDDRYLRVLKLRGSGYREGMHAFRIARSGLVVYPRTVTPRRPAAYVSTDERVTTGVPELDRMLGGGLWRGSSAVVAGPAGSGKTTFALGFAIDGVRRGEPTLYMNLQENPTQLARALSSIGEDMEEMVERGFRPVYVSPVELHIDSVVVQLFEETETHGIRRVVIDALGDLTLSAPDLERFHDFLYAITQHLTVSGVTTLLTLETPEPLADRAAPRGTPVSSLVDAIIALGMDPLARPPHRSLRIVKARALSHPLASVEMMIGERGIRLLSGDEDA